MSLTTRSKVIKIGNSRGIRIPRILLEQAGLTAEVELSVEGDKLIIQSASHFRQGWDAHFQEMAEQGDDNLLDQPSATEWDETEWKW